MRKRYPGSPFHPVCNRAWTLRSADAPPALQPAATCRERRYLACGNGFGEPLLLTGRFFLSKRVPPWYDENCPVFVSSGRTTKLTNCKNDTFFLS
ncbi:MAG: hypothetical protein D6679_08140 [Candidatus Hydrogenedentota bacterium]|nr:MAG: hypothetical protein D6679_08140 [Candidatus Hydrogenedentota bacterium]